MSSEQQAHNLKQHSPSSCSRRPPVSERKLHANRQNARLSTGPKTARGKRTVARNAIKHGLLAREVVITVGEGAENQKDFNELLESLRKEFDPVGAIEDSLVQTIATCWWRKARLLRAENGEICKRLDTAKVDHALRASDEANLGLAIAENGLPLFDHNDRNLLARDRWVILQRAQTSLRGHPSSLQFLAGLLRVAKSQLAADGQISKKVRERLSLAFGFWKPTFALSCLNADAIVGKQESTKESEGQRSDAGEDKAVDQVLRESLLAMIDDHIEWINILEGYAVERGKLEAESQSRSCSLPPAEVTDKLLRYESHLDRQLYRAMDELERRQKLRKGEKVTPPLHVNRGRRS